MRAFSQLLDDLVYTRSRNTKLKLIGDYLKATPDPDRGIALAALTGTLDIPHVKPAVDPRTRRGADRPGAVPDEPRLCRRFGRDDVAAVADLGRGRAGNRRCDRRHREGHRAASDREQDGRAEGPGRIARPSRRLGPLRPAEAGDGRASRWNLRAACQAGARGCVRDRCGSGRGGLARPCAALSRAVRLGRGPRPPTDRARRSGVPAVHARPPARRYARSRSTTMRRSGNGTGFAFSSCTSPARPGSTAAPATTSAEAFRRSPKPLRRDGVLDGELLVRGSDQGTADLHGGAAASFNALQQRLGRKNVSQKMLRTYPAFVRLYDILFDGAGRPARARLDAIAGGGWSGSCRASIQSGSTCRN